MMIKAGRDQLRIDEAKSVFDFMFLRRLRNQVRHLMTNDTTPISYFRQLRFFLSVRRGSAATASVRIFIARFGLQRAGYLLVQMSDGVALITEAVDQSFRRQGVGKELVAFAQSRYPKIVVEIREDNEGSIALHRKMGFAPEQLRNGIAIYRFCR